MSIQEIIQQKIVAQFSPSFYNVENESKNHSGNATESHYKIIVVSDNFIGVSLINRHRALNKLFKEELNIIHALAMHTYTDKEWRAKTSGAPKSPQCSH